MPSCLVYRFLVIFFLSLHAPLPGRASRTLDFASDVGLASSLRSRSLLDLQDHDSIGAAQSNPEKVPQKHWRDREFSGMLMAKEMGSKPPDCDGKCALCQPCQAVQVAVSNSAAQNVEKDSQHQSTLSAAPDDTNYMPEIWRCACGNDFYNP